GHTGRAALESAELLQKGAQIGSRHSDDATRAARLLSPDDVQTIQKGIDLASQGWILGPDDFGTFSSYADLQAAFPSGTIPLQALRPHEPGWNTGSSVWWSLPDPESPVRVVLVDGKIYTADGANRVTAAITLGRDSIPYTLGAAEDEAFVREVLARFQVPSSYQGFRDYYHHVPQYRTR
ncbi:MAG: hypothetical protein HY319_27625, partial [Armatimonadetes bacterium]|nr:hypothetical protein [Armatimonadota bacterium]